MKNETQIRHYMNTKTGMIESEEIIEHVEYSDKSDTHKLIAIETRKKYRKLRPQQEPMDFSSSSIK